MSNLFQVSDSVTWVNFSMTYCKCLKIINKINNQLKQIIWTLKHVNYSLVWNLINLTNLDIKWERETRVSCFLNGPLCCLLIHIQICISESVRHFESQNDS